MNDEMLEVVYVNGEDETGRVRKARGHKRTRRVYS